MSRTPCRATFALASVLSIAAGGCAHAPTPPRTVGPASSEIEVDELEGRKLAVLRLSSRGLVRVSLFIDAGSRDAEPPQVATLAAELAAAAAGPEVEAWTSPDAIELSVEGEADELPALLERLGNALALRTVDASALAQRISALEAQRARALSDPARMASELSLRAVLGASAEGLFPLGRAEDDGAISRASVEAFLAEAFGADRTFVVIAGDITRASARDAWARATRRWPAAGRPRREPEPLEGRFAVEVQVDSARAFVATALLPSIDTAIAARALLEESALARTGAATAFAYPIEGGALLTVSAAPNTPASTEPALVRTLLRAIDAADADAAVAYTGSMAGRAHATSASVREVARQVGLRWAASGEAAPRAVAVGLGVVIDGGRGDDAREDDPDASLAGRAETELEATLRAARAAANPSFEPDANEPGWLKLANGSRVRFEPSVSSASFGLAIAFEGGLAEEPPDVQGRTRLIAMALAKRCGRELGSEAIVRGFAEDRAFGIWLETTADQWTGMAQRALDCALAMPLDARSIEDARVLMLQRLEDEPEWPLFAAISRAIAPGAPGLVWSLGRPDSLDRVRVAGVRAMLERARVGKRVRISASAPVPEETVLRFLASAVGSLAPGEAPPPQAPGTATEGPMALESPGVAFVTAALRLPPGSATSARAYADAFAEALRAEGLPVTLSVGGGGRWGRWAAVRVEGAPADLPALAARLQAIRPRQTSYTAKLQERMRARRWSTSTPGAFAALTVAEEPTPAESEPAAATLPDATATVLLVGRDQSEEAMELLHDARR
jgi:predicted Zn-dependent peptidase